MTSLNSKLVAAAAVASIAAFAVPVAQAGFQGPPDAIDRYNTPTTTWDGPPDAIDRYKENLALFTQPLRQGSPDAIDRYLGRTAAAPVVSSADGFAWGDFGIGAGAMLGIVLIVGVLVLGAGSLRHRSSTLRTS